MLEITDTVYEWSTAFSSRKGCPSSQNLTGKVYNFGSGANNPDSQFNNLLESMVKDSESKISDKLKSIRTQNIKVLQSKKIYDPKENRYSFKWLSIPNPSAALLPSHQSSALTSPRDQAPQATPHKIPITPSKKLPIRISDSLEKKMANLSRSTRLLYQAFIDRVKVS